MPKLLKLTLTFAAFRCESNAITAGINDVENIRDDIVCAALGKVLSGEKQPPDLRPMGCDLPGLGPYVVEAAGDTSGESCRICGNERLA
jgi:hypothetical protein